MRARTDKERLYQWEEANAIDEVDQHQADNAAILENLEDSHTSPQLENLNDAFSSNKSLIKYPSKLSVKRKFEDSFSEDVKWRNSTYLIHESLKNVSESMAAIARALNTANENFFKYNIRVYSATEIYAELEKHGVPNDKLLDAAKFLKANNDLADTIGCPARLKWQWLEHNGF